MAIDRVPPYWDEAWYLYQGAVQLRSLQTGGLPAWFHTWSTLDPTRPSLVPTLLLPFYAVFGVSAASGLLLNLVGFVVLILACYTLGRSIHSPRAGLLSAIVVGSYPVLIGLTHILLIELVMVAFVAGTLLALWRSQSLRSTRWALVAGLLTGFGFLSKVFYGIFVLGPWLVTVCQSWRDRHDAPPSNRWLWLRNLAAALLLAVIVASPWYALNLGSVIGRSARAAVGTEAATYGPSDPWLWQNLLRYFLSVVGTVVSPAGLVLAGMATIGLLLGWRSSTNSSHRADDRAVALVFLASSIVAGYLVFTGLRNQDTKHIAGILPALAVLTGWGLTELFRRRWAILAVGVGLVMVAQAIVGTFPGPLERSHAGRKCVRSTVAALLSCWILGREHQVRCT